MTDKLPPAELPPRWGPTSSIVRRAAAAIRAGADVQLYSDGWRYVVSPRGDFSAHISPRLWEEIEAAQAS